MLDFIWMKWSILFTWNDYEQWCDENYDDMIWYMEMWNGYEFLIDKLWKPPYANTTEGTLFGSP